MNEVEFIRARLGEEQWKAEQGAGGRHDHLDRDNYGFLWADPARVLAQVAAMRAVVNLHRSWAQVDIDRDAEPAQYSERYCRTCSDGDMSWWNDRGRPEHPCPTLRHLAAIWCDHPDYDSEPA